MNTDKQTELATAEAAPATEQGAPLNLSDEQRARITARLMDLARGVSRATPITMLPKEPHSSHADNDGWF
jgi:hypothetical protein